MDREAIARRALPLVDLTDLNGDCTHEDIDRLCERAITPRGAVAAICIWPRFVSHARTRLDGKLRIATVVNFPDGGTNDELTVVETRQALRDGADEIDLVLPYQAFADGDRSAAARMVRAVGGELDEAPDVTDGRERLLKVILETGELKDEQLIREASRLAIECGADFIKTSTGKVAENATLRSAEIMLEEIASSDRRDIGFKPAGGIRTTEDAGDYLALADRIMGADWAGPRTFRFGASGVLDDLLAAMDGGTAGNEATY